MTKVAIITRTKDREIFLRRALQSVGNQTFSDYVHVIVNDAGNPSKVDKLVDYLDDEQKAKTQVFHRESPSNGPDTIFNESIDRVDSDYFVIHDDDDTWHPDFLKKTVEHLDERPEIAAVVVRTNRIDEVINDDKITKKRTSPWMPDLKVISLYRQCIDNQFTPISTLFRRSMYRSIGKFDDSLPVVGDWEFGIRLLLKYDADFVDSQVALANYHHRKKIGSKTDSVSGKDMHRVYTNIVANRYLRQEINEGRLGLGYIMSSLKYEEQRQFKYFKRFIPKKIISLIER